MDDLYFPTPQEFGYDSFDILNEENCRLNTDFEEREVNLGDIKGNPEFWK